MQRIVVWLALACLALTAGVFAWNARRGDESVPMTPLTPAMPIARPADPAIPQQGSIGDRPDVDAPAAPDTRVARLEVELRHQLGGSAAIAAPFRDVDVAVDLVQGERVNQRVRTDEHGVARLDVPGGHLGLATIASGPSTTTSVELRGGETVRATLTLNARVVVQGHVVDPDGQPVAGADVVVLPWIEPDGRSPRTRRVGRSGADGSFTIGLAVGGRVGALREGFAPSPMFGIPPAADPTEAPVRHALQLVLAKTLARIDVLVVDVGGRPVPRAEVELRSTEAAPPGASLAAAPQRHHTGDDGRTEFVVRPGRFEYVARKKGHATAIGRGEVRPAQTAALEIRMPASCAVHGFVETTDGVRTPGARVWSGTTESAIDFVVTDADGAFRLEDLPPGVHELRAREGAAIATAADALRARTRVELAPGQTGNWVAVLQPPSRDGIVSGDVVDADGRPLPGWRVHLRGAGKLAKVVTDERGTFRGQRPSPGLVDALVYAPDTAVGGFAATVGLGVDPDAGPLHLVVDRNARTTTLVGRVVSNAQAPLPATVVCFHHERRETARFQAQPDGVIRVPRVPPGVLDVRIEHPAKSPVSRKQLRAEPDLSLDLGLVVMGDAATLRGSLTGPGGMIPENAVVALQTKEQRILGEYSAGTYRFDSAPPGQHVLQVQGTGVAPWNVTVNLSAGVALTQDIELLAGVPRRLVVRLPGRAEGVASLAIRVPGDAHTWIGTSPLRVETNGARHSFAEFVAYMAPGTYEAIAWCGETLEARESVGFVDGDDSPVTLMLTPR